LSLFGVCLEIMNNKFLLNLKLY